MPLLGSCSVIIGKDFERGKGRSKDTIKFPDRRNTGKKARQAVSVPTEFNANLRRVSGNNAMKLGLINSAWAQAGRETAYGIRMTKEIGFDTIDIFADPLDLDVKERRLIKRECDRAGLPIISIACVAVGLIDFNPSVQKFHVERCRAYLDLAYEYEAKNFLLVLGEYVWERQVIAPAEQWRTGVHNVRELGKYAADLGLQIALELEPFKLSLLNNVENIVFFLDAVDPPILKANIDISHL